MPPPTTINHHTPPPFTSQNISTTTHHQPKYFHHHPLPPTDRIKNIYLHQPQHKIYPSKKVFYKKTRKCTGFKSLRLKYWEINQTATKCQMIFGQNLQKRSKIAKVNINIKFCILKLVYS